MHTHTQPPHMNQRENPTKEPPPQKKPHDNHQAIEFPGIREGKVFS